MRSVVAALVGILLATTAAGDPPEKPKPKLMAKAAAKPTPPISAKRQAELAATLAKRKAASRAKRNATAIRDARLAAIEAKIHENDEKMAPYRAAAAINQQAAMNNLQLQRQQSYLLSQQAALNRQRQILLMELSGQGIMYGPNGPILPGDRIGPVPQSPSLGGFPIMGP